MTKGKTHSQAWFRLLDKKCRNFGRNVARRRGELGQSQVRLAEATGLTPNAIEKLEAGDRASPRLDTVLRILAAQACTLEQLLVEPTEETRSARARRNDGR